MHDVFAVDILISSGEGKTKEKDTRTTVYKKTDISYSLKMKASRGINSYIMYLVFIVHCTLVSIMLRAIIYVNQ